MNLMNDFQASDLILIMKKEQVKKIERAFASYKFRSNVDIVIILNRMKRMVSS